MKSHILKKFRDLLANLPHSAQKDAQEAFNQFRQDPTHPGLQFKKVTGKDGNEYWAARIGLHYRTLGYMDHGEMYWFWIGSHAEYDKLVA